jgi:hypothetical protein
MADNLLQLSATDPVCKSLFLHLMKTIVFRITSLFQVVYVYLPPKGIAMGSPLSSIIAEIFFQYYENVFIIHLLESRNMIYYIRYVNDIFIIGLYQE